MQIVTKIAVPTGLKPKEAAGILLSLLTAVEEVCQGTRKASYFRHFWRERLTSGERKKLTVILSSLQFQLLALLEESNLPLTESHLCDQIPKQAAKILDLFRRQ